MFFPQNVAIIGASNNKSKVGHAIMKSLNRGFEGDLFPINPNEESVLGYEVYDSVSEINKEIDVSVLSLPASLVPGILKECGESGVKNVIVVSAGFSEAGREDLEEESKEIAERYDMNLLGPNCLGIFNSRNKFDTIFNPPERQARPEPGDIAFLSQSGAFGAAALDWFAESDIGLSKFVSYGNRAHVDEADLIYHLSEDENTDYIIIYIEGVKDGREFFRAAKACEKPIIAIKSGRTDKGSSAATSHTASMAGNDNIYEGAFKQSDIIRIKTLEEMFNIAKALSFQPLPEGKKLGIVTNGGGAGVMATDLLIEKGLELATFSKKTKKEFNRAVQDGIIPGHATLNNPVDIIGDASSERYKKSLEIILDDGDVDIAVVISLFQSPVLGQDIVEKLDKLQDKGKSILVVAPGGEFTRKMIEKIEKKKIPVYQTTKGAIEAAHGLWRCSEHSP